MNAHESLRTDERQWLIYETDGETGALVRGLEAFAMQVAGRLLARNPIDALRGLGHFMLRIADARLREMLRNDGAQAVVVRHLEKLMAVAVGKTPWTPDVDRALDELYALTTHVDHRASGAGITGPGTLRDAVRGD